MGQSTIFADFYFKIQVITQVTRNWMRSVVRTPLTFLHGRAQAQRFILSFKVTVLILEEDLR